MSIKQLKRKLKARSPKTFEKAVKKWDVKMIPDVMKFIVSIGKHIKTNDGRFTYDGEIIEFALWKLLAKSRRLK